MWSSRWSEHSPASGRISFILQLQHTLPLGRHPASSRMIWLEECSREMILDAIDSHECCESLPTLMIDRVHDARSRWSYSLTRSPIQTNCVPSFLILSLIHI